MNVAMTPAAERAMRHAADWARHLGNATVEPRHLLLALLEEPEGRPARLLIAQGIAAGDFVQTMGATVMPSWPVVDEKAPIPGEIARFSYAARSIAHDVAGEATVATEHLLLALLQEDVGVRRSLEEAGLDVEQVFAHFTPPALPLEEPLRLVETTEQMHVGRILDANANRAREALRVLEEHARFVLDDGYLSSAWKSLRHDLTQSLAALPVSLLLEARDTLADVGTTISTPTEEQRLGLRDVVAANAKRLQEALRTLEEYGKVHNAAFGRAVEGLRYRSYVLEKAVVIGTTSRARLADAQLYVLLTGATCEASLEWTIKEAAAGGAQLFQLREKQLSDRELLERARDVRRWTRQGGVLFIMNDRPDVARLVEADGVHLGQDDLPVATARRIIGPDLLIGVSTHDLSQLERAIRDGASYVGIGPTFPGKTKEFAEFAGMEFIHAATRMTSLPAFAIGGISLENVAQAVAAGAKRVAVSHAICATDDPQLAARQLRAALPSLPSSAI